MPINHAILGPSAADKWVNCPPSARFEEQIAEEAEETVFAREGGFAHDLAELYLSVRAGVFVGDFWVMHDQLQDEVFAFYAATDETKDPTAEWAAMVEHAEGWAEFVCAQLGLNSTIYIEQQFDLSEYIPIGFGTSDAAVKSPSVLYVNDYKYGAGKRVKAYRNRQGMCYALGVIKALQDADPDYWPDKIVISIWQPRIENGHSSFEITPDELYDWAETELKPAAVLAMGGQGTFKAGKHCQFCKARTVCKKYYDMFARLKGIRDSREMTAKEIEIVLATGELIAAWAKKVREEATRKAMSGKPVHGFKLVAGGTRRTFTSEDDVIDTAMGANLDLNALMRTELLPLTDIEKLVGKKHFKEVFEGIIYDKEYMPKLVDWDDPRPKLGRTAHDDYDDDDAI